MSTISESPSSLASTPHSSLSSSPASSVCRGLVSPNSDVDSGCLRFIFLPSTRWLDAQALRRIVPDGTIALIVARSAKERNDGVGEEWRCAFVERALGDLRAAGVFGVADPKWIQADVDSNGETRLLSFISANNGDIEIKDLCAVQDEEDQPPVTIASAFRIFACAALRSIAYIPSHDEQYALFVLERPAVVFPPLEDPLVLPSYPNGGELLQKQESGCFGDVCNAHHNPFGVPTRHEWRTLWTAWDMVTLDMIPCAMLLQQPIDLRHKCLFYIGHIPTFVDMLLNKAIGGEPTEPKRFWHIFERGIDPHVDDPQTCHHYHSAVPEADEDWPSLSAVLTFRDDVRSRLMKVYDDLMSGRRAITRHLARTLVMVFEHEGFHVETLLYMLIQRAGTGTLPPPGFTPPLWTFLSSQWSASPHLLKQSTILGPCAVVLGHSDCEAEDFVDEKVEGHSFGWDNESPKREVWVKRFEVEWRPVSNDDYLRFLEVDGNKMEVPKSWVVDGEEVKIRTLYGPVSFDIARHWPVLTSYDDLATYARFKGGRLPTEPELRLFLDTYEVGYEGGANIGFRNWHPVPATTGLEENGGRGSNGGVWEWTSTVFDGHEGLAPTKLFPGYSTDFFDGKHQVVLGASYATIPRIAGRRTVRNFYQHNYPYAWVGARVAYDL